MLEKIQKMQQSQSEKSSNKRTKRNKLNKLKLKGEKGRKVETFMSSKIVQKFNQNSGRIETKLKSNLESNSTKI